MANYSQGGIRVLAPEATGYSNPIQAHMGPRELPDSNINQVGPSPFSQTPPGRRLWPGMQPRVSELGMGGNPPINNEAMIRNSQGPRGFPTPQAPQQGFRPAANLPSPTTREAYGGRAPFPTNRLP